MNAAAVGGMPQRSQVAGMPAQPHPQVPQGRPPKRKKPTDKTLPRKLENFIPESKLYNQLQEFEKKLDATIIRKRIDLQEALTRPHKMKRTLRIFISNLASDQFIDADSSMELESVKAPSWTLRIEGRLLDTVSGKKQPTLPAKFSSFVKSVFVELQRDATLYPDGNIVEWHKQPGMAECDGFEIKRRGDSDCPVKIYLHLDANPEKYKLSPELARLLDIQSDTKSNVIMALWQYVKLHKLQDAEDKRQVCCDASLSKVSLLCVLAHVLIFNNPKIFFTQIPEFLNKHLFPCDPIVLDYVVRVDKEYHVGQHAFDIEVEVDDPIRAKMSSFITENTAISKELATFDEKIVAIIQSIHQSKMKRDFFLSFATDPVGFVKQWMASQSRDMEIILGDMRMNVEESRGAGFYEQPWVNEAIFRYLNGVK